MTEPVHNITNVDAVPLEKPSLTKEIEDEADVAISYLERFIHNPTLDPELRMALNDIKNTIKVLKQTVHAQNEMVLRTHNQMVELTRAQRLI